MQKSCFLKQCSFTSNFYEEKVVLNIISLWINPQYIQKNTSLKTKLSFKMIFWAAVNEKGVFRTWHFKRKKKITSLHSYLKRSMSETLFGTLTNLLYSVQKNLTVRTRIIQKPVKWFVNLHLNCFMLEAKLWDDPLVNTTSSATAFLLRFSDILLNLQSDVLLHGKSAPL